jgi:hypothetical protein
MRVFRLSDGTSWVARLEEPGQGGGSGWEAVVFQKDPETAAQRLVYRPSGWLDAASVPELTAALEEGVTVRLRWG